MTYFCPKNLIRSQGGKQIIEEGPRGISFLGLEHVVHEVALLMGPAGPTGLALAPLHWGWWVLCFWRISDFLTGGGATLGACSPAGG